jgi:sodium transport system permease protein
MTIRNVKLVFFREVRDQLRDRRTLFMIAILPILLYPLLGMSMFQVTQFMQAKPTRVLVVGADNLNNLPPLFENQRFASYLFKDDAKIALLELVFPSDAALADGKLSGDAQTAARTEVQSGNFDAALYFPPDFAQRLEAFHEAVVRRTEDRNNGHAPPVETSPIEVPSPEIIYTTANEKSQVAFARLWAVLHRWTEQVGEENLSASGVSSRAMRPFSLESADVAKDTGHRGAALWSKLLPVLLLLWTLTGAFYPAVDLCAGEKERGTLETLLSSPAQRSEIVVGKLLTIMLFSVVAAALNLASVGITGWAVLEHLEGFGLPPTSAMVVLAVALVPVAALFSALCLALAAFARSSKEGQYYLMPLLLLVMPLVVMPMSPGVDLDFGNSLIPITNIVLLLRCVLEGDYLHAIQFAPTVIAITFAACLLSIRWAVDQFNSESVLFREGERLDLRLWLRHLVRDRQPTPTVAAALACGVLIWLLRFFLGLSFGQPNGFAGFVRMALATQVAVIATPALLMTIMLTGSPRQTLLLKRPPWLTIPAAAVLAFAVHPVANYLTSLCRVNENVRTALEGVQAMLQSADVWTLIFVLAIVPAFCEEIAFRGFVLSGLRHIGNNHCLSRGAKRQPLAGHNLPRHPQFARPAEQPRHAGDALTMARARLACFGGRRRRLHVLLAVHPCFVRRRPPVACLVCPPAVCQIARRIVGTVHRAGEEGPAIPGNAVKPLGN